MSEFFDKLETRSAAQREAEQFALLQQQLAHAKEQTPAFAELFAEVDPGAVQDRTALARLPLLRKSELIKKQEQQPVFGGLCAIAAPELAQIFVSPGPIFEPGSARPDFWRFARALYAAGVRSGDILQNCFSYHFTPAGMMFESGARALGCVTIPAGAGQTEQQVQVMARIKPMGYVGTPSFLKIILDQAAATGIELKSLNKALVSGEYLPPKLRETWAERGIATLQCYATADLGLIAYESPAREGLIVDEGIILEIVRPGTADPLPAGEVGEVVVTSLTPDYPLIRFATGDLSAILPGPSPCGRTNQRIKGWLGRADQTAKVRGLFVHPSQVADVIKRHPEVAKGRLVLSRENDSDRMLLQCECATAAPDLTAALQETVRAVCRLRAEIELVPSGNLPNDGKVIEDTRPVAS